ncbi:MAG: hypothetical protein HC838_02890 [Spirulinaceae cyanobacterium RM2_2_10]|nr:hypothetical protein [Spirulinaceae cyanobacterium RM2_2_10]
MNNTKLLTGTLASALGVACLAVPLSTEASVYRDGGYYSIDPQPRQRCRQFRDQRT